MNIQQRYPSLFAVLKSWQHQDGAIILQQIAPLIISARVGAELGLYEGLRSTPEKFSRLANVSSVSDAARAVFEVMGSFLTYSAIGVVGGAFMAADIASHYIRQNSNVDELNLRPDIVDPEDAKLEKALVEYFESHPEEI